MCKKIIALFVVIVSIVLSGCNKESSKEINISIAASLLEPMSKICEQYSNENNVKININSGGSGTLKKQISEGAEVSVFFSAKESYVDDLINEGIISSDSKINLIGNRLVLLKNNDSQEKINDIFGLNNLKGKIALGEISTVPAGQYAKEALENISIWGEIQDNIIYANNVTAVRTYVERGEVDYGIVYETDALNLEHSKVVQEIPEKYHSEITYTIAIIKDYEKDEDIIKLVDFIMSANGKNIFEEYGFKILLSDD